MGHNDRILHPRVGYQKFCWLDSGKLIFFYSIINHQIKMFNGSILVIKQTAGILFNICSVATHVLIKFITHGYKNYYLIPLIIICIVPTLTKIASIIILIAAGSIMTFSLLAALPFIILTLSLTFVGWCLLGIPSIILRSIVIILSVIFVYIGWTEFNNDLLETHYPTHYSQMTCRVTFEQNKRNRYNKQLFVLAWIFIGIPLILLLPVVFSPAA